MKKISTHLKQLFRKPFPLSKTRKDNFSSSAEIIPKSSLFISGERAADTFVVVIPYLDFDQRLSNLPELGENIKRRKFSFNLFEMKESWEFYKDWNKKKIQLQENLNEVSIHVNELSRKEKNENNKGELEKLERCKSLIQEDLQQVKKNVWHMEDSIVCELLKLPNSIHPDTPEEDEDMFVYNKEDIKEGVDHVQIGVKLNCLDYRNELECYLKNKAALFELAVPELFIDKFTNQRFIRFSNPDFTRSVLAEGVSCAPIEFSEQFLLRNTEGKNDHLHLCGGASLYPFCGFHAKQSVPKKFLPARYIASGRRYCPVTSSLQGLYSVNQSTSVQLFVATSSPDKMYLEFKSCVEKLREIYCSFGLKFKIVKQPAHSLKSWESLRVSIQVYSTHEKAFVETGSVSLIGDFISKRLKMCYVDGKELFLNVVSGTAVNTQTLLALCLERSREDLFIPSAVKDYMVR